MGLINQLSYLGGLTLWVILGSMDNRNRDVKFPSRSGEGDVNMVTGVFVTHLFEYEDLAEL